MKRPTSIAIAEALKAGRALVRAVDIASGEERLIIPYEDQSPLGIAAADAARRDRSSSIDIDGRSWFLNIYNPPLDLVIVGAVHIAQILAEMARLADYTVRIIDPRTVFATVERFPGASLSHEWPDDALAKSPLGARSGLVALSHDPKLDDPALQMALRSSCFYIGALGSKKNHANRIARLKELGFSDAQLARIHGPIGLTIGARSPAEIAVSIIAEMTMRLRTDGGWERSAARATA